MTFITDPACTGIPKDARQRTYLATTTRDQTSGSQIKMTVLDPSVLHDYTWEGIFIHAAGNYLVMLNSARFNKSKAAKALGLTRHQLYIRMRKHGME